MEARTTIVENWLTRKPAGFAINATMILGALMLLFHLLLSYDFPLEQWLTASPLAVFKNHEYWRLWTSLFVHADARHLLSNAMLFLPLSYLFWAHFGWLLFPLLALLSGGIINLLVLMTLPEEASLVGISGVVYWLGAAWLTLFFLIDRRESIRRRTARVLFLALLLFIPETFEPHTSYLSHFLGFILGTLSATGFYFIFRKRFLAAEVTVTEYEEEEGLQACGPSLCQQH